MRPLLALLGVLVSGCAAAPWSEVSGRAGASPGLDLAGTVILGVDGHWFLEQRETWRISPGKHEVLVTSTRTRRNAVRTSLALELGAEPCTRYYIVARHDNALDLADWRPEVLRSEPVEGCRARPGR